MAIDTSTQAEVKHFKNYIGGEWVDAASGETFEVVNPATEEVVATVPKGGREDAQRAIAAARETFDSGVWSGMDPEERKRILLSVIDGFTEVEDELATLETMQAGMTIRATSTVVIGYCINHWDYFAPPGDAARCRRRSSRSRYPTHSYNFVAARAGRRLRRDHPVELPARDGGLEARAGARDGQHLRPEAGVEHAAHGSQAGRDPRRDGPAQGRRERHHRRRGERRRGAGVAPRRRQGRLHGLDGGRAPDHAARLEHDQEGDARAGRQVAEHRLRRRRHGRRRSTARSGRRSSTRARSASPARGCCSPSRSTTSSSSASSSGRSRSRSATRWTTSPTWARSSPRRSARRSRTTCRIGKEEGAKLVLGGKRPEGDGFERGYWYEPTIFTEVDNSMTIAQEEIFGPVLSVIKYKDDDDAIRIANDTIYGLASGVWSTGPRPLPDDGQAAAGGHGLDQRLPPDQLHRALRRLQAVGHRAGAGGLRPERVHRGQARALGPRHAEGAEDVRGAAVASRR